MKKSYVYLLTTFMLWGSLYVVSQFVLGKIPTFTVAMFRYLIAFIALSLISLKSEKKKKQQKVIINISLLWDLLVILFLLIVNF